MRRGGGIDPLLGAGNLCLGILDGLLERSGVRLLQRGLVTQARCPIRCAFQQGRIAFVHGVDAQTQQFERARSLACSADTTVDALKTMLQVGHAALQRTQALARLGQANLGIGELASSLGIVTANAVELVIGLGNLQAQVARLRTSLVTRTGELVHARARSTNGLCGLLAALGNAHTLGLGIVGALLQTADLGQQGAAFALKTGDLAGGITLGGTCLLDGRIGLDDLIRHMLKHGSQIGLQALQLANATLALQSTRRLAGIEAHAHQTATAYAGAIGGHIGHTVNDRRNQRGSQVIDHVIATEQRLDNRAITGTHGKAIDQTRTGSALGSSTAAHAARHQQRLARGLLLVQGGTPGTLKRGGVIKQQGIDIAGK